MGFLLACLLAAALRPILALNAERPSAEKNMKAIGLAFRMYANGSEEGRWPGLATNARIWAPDLARIVPDFLQDPALLVAWEHPDAGHLRKSLRVLLAAPNPDYDTAAGLMALSFSYLGSAVLDESEFKLLLDARTRGLLETMGREATTKEERRRYLPLRDGGERDPVPSLHCSIGDSPAQSSIPVLVETWRWKLKRESSAFEGAHVLFMDGHVEWLPLGTFPVVPSVLDGLCGIVPEL
jgi:prepilin-type processing-associated H-X9-DG protein